MATYTVKLPPTLAEVRAEKVAAIKAEAYRRLLPTDWYVVRHAETGQPAPAEVLAYRQAVREAVNLAEQDVMALGTIEEVLAYSCKFPKEEVDVLLKRDGRFEGG